MKRLIPWVLLLFGVALSHFPSFAQGTAEELAITETFQLALERNQDNEATTWVNPDTGASGATTPLNAFQDASGRYCREFVQTIIIGGEEQQGFGTACRQADGSWRIVTLSDGSAATYQVVERPYYVYGSPGSYHYPWGLYYPYNIFISFGFFHHHHFKGHHFHHRKHDHGFSRFHGGSRFEGVRGSDRRGQVRSDGQVRSGFRTGSGGPGFRVESRRGFRTDSSGPGSRLESNRGFRSDSGRGSFRSDQGRSGGRIESGRGRSGGMRGEANWGSSGRGGGGSGRGGGSRR